MLKLAVFFALVLAAALLGAWIAERPGTVAIVWFDHRIALSTTVAVALFAVLLGVCVFAAWAARAVAARTERARADRRRAAHDAGVRALLDGLVALGAGDRRRAIALAGEARTALPGEPTVRLLDARIAAAGGERAQARAHLAALIDTPATRLAGLHGLYLEARADRQPEVARHFAEEAAALDPSLEWVQRARFDHAVAIEDWEEAAALLAADVDHVIATRDQARRWRAVLLTARAVEIVGDAPRRARALALEAHDLAPALVPAAVAAARLSAAAGEPERAARIIEAAWWRAPHPDLAAAYADLDGGDADFREGAPGSAAPRRGAPDLGAGAAAHADARERLARFARLAAMRPDDRESALVLAQAAIEAGDLALTRRQLARLADCLPTQRVCELLARLADAEDDAGAARDWLARAVHAPRDPAWIADGVIAASWSPVSPVTGRLDAFEWRVPAELPVPALETLTDRPLLKHLAPPAWAGANTRRGASPADAVDTDSGRAARSLRRPAADAADAADIDGDVSDADDAGCDAPGEGAAAASAAATCDTPVATDLDASLDSDPDARRKPGAKRAPARGRTAAVRASASPPPAVSIEAARDADDEKVFEEIRKALLARTGSRRAG